MRRKKLIRFLFLVFDRGKSLHVWPPSSSSPPSSQPSPSSPLPWTFLSRHRHFYFSLSRQSENSSGCSIKPSMDSNSTPQNLWSLKLFLPAFLSLSLSLQNGCVPLLLQSQRLRQEQYRRQAEPAGRGELRPAGAAAAAEEGCKAAEDQREGEQQHK